MTTNQDIFSPLLPFVYKVGDSESVFKNTSNAYHNLWEPFLVNFSMVLVGREIMKWLDIKSRRDISSAQIISDQITFDKVYMNYKQIK